jgi:urease accessory protein
MKTQAHVIAARSADGTTRLTRLSGGGPLTLRPTGSGRQARVHLVAGVFGPLGGDELTLRVTVEAGAQLEVAAAAATLVLPSRSGQASSMRILIDVAEAARLTLAAPPTVVCAGASHCIDVDAVVAGDGELVLREETVRGRTGEAGGDVTLRSRVDVCGIPVLRQNFDLRGAVGGAWAPRAVGSLLSVGPEQKPPTMGVFEETTVRAAWLALPQEAGYQLTALGDDALALSQLLDGERRQLPRYVV